MDNRSIVGASRWLSGAFSLSLTPYGHGIDEIQAGGPQAGGPAKGRWGEAGGGQGPYRHPKNPTATVPPFTAVPPPPSKVGKSSGLLIV